MVENLPYPALELVLYYLRIPEIKALSEAYPHLNNVCQLEIRKKLGRRWLRRKFFKWNRYAARENEDVMAERHSHSLVYYPQNQSVYCFGGEVIDKPMEGTVGGPPSFNDIWRFDMAKLRWSRVNVTHPPYPGAKFGATFVVWRDEIVLYGGLGSANYRNVSIRLMACNQIHIFNPQTETWRIMATEVEGPDLLSHTACIKDDLMFVYGGRMAETPAHQKLYILDLKQEQWKVVDLFPNLRMIHNRQERLSNGFPILDLRKSQIIWIRDGCLLVTGEMISDYGLSFIVTYNPDTMAGWNWKAIPTEGRWWKPRMIERFETLMRDSECADPNYKFDPIAVMRNEGEKMMRLVSLGRAQGDLKYFQSPNSLAQQHDAVQNRGKLLTLHIQDVIDRESEKRIDNRDQEFGTDLSGEFEGTSYRIENCFLEQSVCRALFENKGAIVVAKRCNVFLESEHVDKWNGVILDPVDIWETTKRIKTIVAQSQNKHFKSILGGPAVAKMPSRHRHVHRLTIYTAEIDLSVEIEKIVWKPQPLQFRAAPETLDYKLVATENEVVMHGGYSDLRAQARQMGHTYVLTPVDHVDRPVEPPPLFRNSTWPPSFDRPSTSRQQN